MSRTTYAADREMQTRFLTYWRELNDVLAARGLAPVPQGPAHLCWTRGLTVAQAADHCQTIARPLIGAAEIQREMLAVGVPIDHHTTDLYVPVTPESTAIIDRYRFRDIVTTFRSNTAPHVVWYDIPFAYRKES